MTQLEVHFTPKKTKLKTRPQADAGTPDRRRARRGVRDGPLPSRPVLWRRDSRLTSGCRCPPRHTGRLFPDCRGKVSVRECGIRGFRDSVASKVAMERM